MTKLTSFFDIFSENYPGVDPMGHYCLMTGRQIGTNYETVEMVESSTMDLEELADDVAMRLFAAMRPGLFWNKMNLKSVAMLQTTRPVETLAWLLNRWMNPPHFKGDVFAINHDRILVYHWCERVDADLRVELIDRLISLDSRLSLNGLAADFSFDSLLMDGADNCLFPRIESAEKAADKREKDMEQQTRWYRDGNTMSKAAAVETFFKKKPESKAVKATKARSETTEFMDSILSALMTGTATPASLSVDTPKPAQIIAPTTPKSSGLSFLMKKAN